MRKFYRRRQFQFQRMAAPLLPIVVSKQVTLLYDIFMLVTKYRLLRYDILNTGLEDDARSQWSGKTVSKALWNQAPKHDPTAYTE